MALITRYVSITDMGISRGTSRTIYVKWHFNEPIVGYQQSKEVIKFNTTDHYEVEWSYSIDTGVRFEGPTDTISSGYYVAEYTPPENAKRVWVRVKPVSKTHTVSLESGDVTRNYWNGEYSSKVEFNITTQTKVQKRYVELESLGSSVIGPREVYITWEFTPPTTSNLGNPIVDPKSTVEGYEVEWKYTYGDKDEDGDLVYTIVDASTVPANQKNAYYSADENVKKVACRVKPISTKYVEEEYWTGEYSRWVYYKIPTPEEAQTGGMLTVETPDIDPGTGELYVTWSWTPPFITSEDPDSSNSTDHFEFEWQYQTSTGNWYEGTSGNANLYNTTWSVPTAASIIRFRVKPIPKTHMVNGYETEYWVHDFSGWEEFEIPVEISYTPAEVQNMEISITPGSNANVSLIGVLSTTDTLTVSIENIADHQSSENEEGNTDRIEIEVVMDNDAIFSDNMWQVSQFHNVTAVIDVNLGHSYKVRARGIKDLDPNTGTIGYGPWSEYSSSHLSRPEAPVLMSVQNRAEGQVKVTWSTFDGAGANTITVYYGDENTPYDEPSGSKSAAKAMGNVIITGLDTSGKKWWFIGAAVNDAGETKSSKLLWITLGTTPTAPTVWTDSYVVAYDSMYGYNWQYPIYWTHNSEDNSYASESELVLQILTTEGGPHAARQVILSANDANLQNDQYSYTVYSGMFADSINFADYPSFRALFDIRTKSSASDKWGPRSATQTIKIYKKPTIYLNMYKTCSDWSFESYLNIKGTLSNPYTVGDKIIQYPLFIGVTETNVGQTPINMSLTLTTLDTYESVNNIGESILVNEGDQIFQALQEYAPSEYSEVFRYVLLPNNAPMKNGIRYQLSCTVTYNSGLTSTNDRVFETSFDTIKFLPNAQIAYNQNDISTIVSPYVYDRNGYLVGNVAISVYRLAFDGTFEPVAQNLENDKRPSVSDPHPTLNRVSYRIVAMSYLNGSISYADIPAYPIPEKAVVLQWNSGRRTVYNSTEENKLASPLLTTSMLKLPYNIDVSENVAPDVSFVEYIGREHPVGYYGTQVGQSLTISSDVDATDSETIDLLRRLSRYMGDVYVRTPNGIGYWANVTVSFSTNHTEMVIPVSLTVTRVEGGA